MVLLMVQIRKGRISNHVGQLESPLPIWNITLLSAIVRVVEVIRFGTLLIQGV